MSFMNHHGWVLSLYSSCCSSIFRATRGCSGYDDENGWGTRYESNFEYFDGEISMVKYTP